MMILCGSPAEFLTSRKPSAPAPPALLIGSIDCFIRLCFATMPCTARAIWSAPPPVPAGMTNSTFLVGSHACVVNGATASATAATILLVLMAAPPLSWLRLWALRAEVDLDDDQEFASPALLRANHLPSATTITMPIAPVTYSRLTPPRYGLSWLT